MATAGKGDDPNTKALAHKLQVVGKVGQGAFGTVFKAAYDGAVVAVKVLTVEGDGPMEQDAKRMFFREALALQKCTHKNIVRYVALCKLNAQLPGLRPTNQGRWALIEEFLKNGTLSKIICNQMATPNSRVYSQHEALLWSLDVAKALLFLHQQDPHIIHRDIKPANVLLTDEDGRQTAKLADFGLHVVIDETRQTLVRAHAQSSVAQKYRSPFFRPQITPDGEMQSLQPNAPAVAAGEAPAPDAPLPAGSTRMRTMDSLLSSMATTVTVASYNGTVIDEDDVAELKGEEMLAVYQLSARTGSAMYMAPEVFKGEPYNEKADVFSFCVTMFELLARTMLLFSELPVATMDPSAPDRYAEKVAGGYRPRKPAKLADELYQLCCDGWHQDPLERPDMVQVVERLEQLLELETSGQLRAPDDGDGCCSVM